MDKLVNVIVWVGKLGLCYPLFHSGKGHRLRLGRLSVNFGKLLQFVLMTLYTIAYNEAVLSPSIALFQDQNCLSETIHVAVNFSSGFIPKILLRLAVFLYWKDLVLTSSSLQFLIRQSTFAPFSSVTRTISYVAVACLIPIPIVYINVMIAFMYPDTTYGLSDIAVLFLDDMAFSFAGLFIICFGRVLVDCYDSQVKKSQEEFLSECLSQDERECTVLLETEEATLEHISERLAVFKREFGKL